MCGRSVSRLGRVLLCATLAALSAGLIAPLPAYAYASDLGAGTVRHLTFHWSFPATSGAAATSGSNDYLVYTPVSWKASDRLPLYVVLHGCPAVPGAGAEATMDSTRVNPVADRERFLVAYLDNGAQCWHAASPGRENTVRGGGGDVDVVAGMTRAVIAGFNVDSERVYIIGFSSGAGQASATAFAYPDLYAAAGVNSGGGPSMDTTCAAMTDPVVPMYAASTYEQMGTRARVVPYFAIAGDGDPSGGEGDYENWVSPNPTGVHPKVSGCTRLGYLEALDIDHLVDPATTYQTSYTQTGQVTRTEGGAPEDGYVWDRDVALDSHGCEVAENWTIHGMGHAWSGGSTDPAYKTYGINDPKGPSTDANSWAFFRQFTLHGGNIACHPVSSQSVSGLGRPAPYRASASGSLVTVNALNVPGQVDASHMQIAPVSATVDSAAKGKAPRSLADARNVTMNVPGEGSQSLGVEAAQSAPSGDTSPVHQEGAAVPAAPVLNADLATADVHAQWSKSACITDGPISNATSTIANGQLEPGGASDDGAGWHGSALGMDDYISPTGTATSTSTISLTRHDTDSRYGLDTTATTQFTGINVSDALYVEVVSPAKAELMATGVPGTAAAVVNQPVLRVEGLTLVSGRTFTTSIPGGPIIEVTPGAVTTQIAADGTTATADGTLAHIKLLDVSGTATVADFTIGALHATSTVPAGGVNCPATSGPPTGDTTTAATAPPALQRESRVARAPNVERGAGALPAKPAAMAVSANRSAPATGNRVLAGAVVMTLGAITLRRRRSCPDGRSEQAKSPYPRWATGRSSPRTATSCGTAAAPWEEPSRPATAATSGSAMCAAHTFAWAGVQPSTGE